MVEGGWQWREDTLCGALAAAVLDPRHELGRSVQQRCLAVARQCISCSSPRTTLPP